MKYYTFEKLQYCEIQMNLSIKRYLFSLRVIVYANSYFFYEFIKFVKHICSVQIHVFKMNIYYFYIIRICTGKNYTTKTTEKCTQWKCIKPNSSRYCDRTDRYRIQHSNVFNTLGSLILFARTFCLHVSFFMYKCFHKHSI